MNLIIFKISSALLTIGFLYIIFLFLKNYFQLLKIKNNLDPILINLKQNINELKNTKIVKYQKNKKLSLFITSYGLFKNNRKLIKNIYELNKEKYEKY